MSFTFLFVTYPVESISKNRILRGPGIPSIELTAMVLPVLTD